MDPTSNAGGNPIPSNRQSRSGLLLSGSGTIFSKLALLHPQRVFTARLNTIDAKAQEKPPDLMGSPNTMPSPSAPGENFEPRQTATSEDYEPDPSKSIPLDKNRQALVDDIIALYSCEPTVERVKRYTADCVYDDQFVYANDRYKMAGQWFALPKLFKKSKNEGYQVIKNEKGFIQFKNKQSWTFAVIPKTATITGLVSLSLDPATIDSDFIQVKYHKDQANDKDYSHEGLGFTFKKWQADNVVKHMDDSRLNEFEADKNAAKEHVRKYGTGKEEGNAPKEDFTKQ